MGVYFITFRSVTTAQRGEGVLRRSGIRCQLQRTPGWMEEQGCGYCLRLQGAEVDRALRQLQEKGIQYRKVYQQEPDGRAREVTG